MLQLLISIDKSLKRVSNNLEKSDEEFIKAIEFKNVYDRSRKENEVKETNTLSSSMTFIKLSCQFDADAANEENSDADVNVKVINEEELINFFIILIE